MKRKLFNPGLYLDSLRRTALAGGLFTVILCVQALLLVFGSGISISDYMQQTDIDIQVETVGMFSMNPAVLAVPLLLVPILMMILFGFVNKRSTSDYWHSTPFTRQCIFVTFTLSAITWAVIAMLISTFVSVMGFLALSKYFAINFASVFSVLLSCFAMCLLVAAAFTVSMSITGTSLNNIVVAALILFLPRVVMLFYGTITSNSVLFQNIARDGFAAGDLNLIFGLFGGFMFAGTDINEMMSSFTSIGYTAGLSVVYFALGMLLFNRRKSEMAAQSAVNRYLQTAFRIIVAFIVCLIPIFIIVDSMNTGYSLDIEEKFVCLVLYVVAMIAYFIYELITTRKAKNMLKAVPALGILAVLNVAFILIAHNTYNTEYNYTPTPDTVSSVRVGIGNSYMGEKNYFDAMMSKTEIQDEELEKLLCELYSDTRTAYENDTLWDDYVQEITVGFKSGSEYKYRSIYLDTESYAKIGQLMEKNDAIKELYNIEKLFDKTVHYDVSVNLNYGELAFNEIEAIKNAYIQDVKAIGFEEWYMVVSNPYTVHFEDNNGDLKYYYELGRFYLSINHNATVYSVTLPITNMMPETYKLIMETVFEYQNEQNLQQKTVEYLQSAIEDGIENNANVNLYNGKALSQSEGYQLAGKEDIESFIGIISSGIGQVPESDSRIAIVSYGYETDNGEWEYVETVFKIPDNADLTFFLGDSELLKGEENKEGANEVTSSQTDFAADTSSAQ